jgi:hypothetical protein
MDRVNMARSTPGFLLQADANLLSVEGPPEHQERIRTSETRSDPGKGMVPGSLYRLQAYHTGAIVHLGMRDRK